MPKDGFIYNPKEDRYFFGIGVYDPKYPVNVGSLMRSAYMYDASYTFTIGNRYKRERSDTPKTNHHIPNFTYKDFDDFWAHIPNNVDIVGVEMDERARPLTNFTWPKRPLILMGAEDIGIPKKYLDKCRYVVQIPTIRKYSLNVSCAASIAMYDYLSKRQKLEKII